MAAKQWRGQVGRYRMHIASARIGVADEPGERREGASFHELSLGR